MSDQKMSNPKDRIGMTKLPMSLLSTFAKIQWCLAQVAGLFKYGAWNWRAAGVRSSIYLDAMERHMEAWKNGEELDPTDGTHHLGNIMACAAILLDAQESGKLIDDRPPSFSHRPALAAAEKQMAVLRKQYESIVPPRHYTIEDTGECFGAESTSP